jgi:predicted ArsR family transcriptional regulator
MTERDPLAAISLLAEPTRRALYEFVTGRADATGRDDAAGALGISRELAAFHLDRLAAAGLLEHEYRRRSGRGGPGAGRPAKLYRRAERDFAVALPERRYAVAADLFAQALDLLAGGSVVADIARARGAGVGLQARRGAGRPSRRRLASALFGLLRDLGFEPDLDRATGVLSLRNCPFRALAADHRELTCAMNRAWAEGVVAGLGDPGLAAQPVSPQEHCCVLFEPAA